MAAHCIAAVKCRHTIKPRFGCIGVGFQPILGNGLRVGAIFEHRRHHRAFHGKVELEVGQELADIGAFCGVTGAHIGMDGGRAEA